MKNLKILTMATLTIALLNSCQKNELDTPTDLETSQVPENVIQKFHDLGVNTFEGVEPFTMDGVTGWRSNDIFLSKDDIKNMPILPKEESIENEKLFRTNALVNVPRNGQRTIRVRGRDLPGRMQQGLQLAVQNYNQLGLKFRMRLSFGSGNGNADIVVFDNGSNGVGAIAGFPSNGNPFNRVSLDNGLRFQPINAIEQVITHELGHCVGLRHSDFRTRRSCPAFLQGNEGDGAVGAIYIPGTDNSGNSVNSIMKSCYSSNDNGEFKRQDRVGLRRIY